MLKTKQPSFFKKPLTAGVLVFILVCIITQVISYQRFQLLQKTEQQEVNERVLSLKEDLQNVLGQSFMATKTLSFIVENYGIPHDFDRIAQLLLSSNKNIEALELANSQGVITHVYPSRDNDVLGFNILQDSISRYAALTTVKRKDYFTAGPFHLKQGGAGFVGRTPLFSAGDFAGFASAIVRLPTIISAVQIDSLSDTQFSYQLAKINPDQSEDVFYRSNEISIKDAIKVPLTTSQGEWKLYVISNQTPPYSTILIFSFLGLLLAIVCGVLVWFLVLQPYRLNQLVQEKTVLLRESNNKFKSLVEQASDGIFLTSPKGVILEVNSKGAEMLGYTLNELIGLTLKDIYDSEEVRYNPIKFKELKAGKVILHERKMIRKDGSHFYGEVNAKMDLNGNLLGVLRDSTERKEAEKSLEAQNLELTKTNSELDSFVYSASHELRAPLSSVLGLINIILSEQNNPNLVFQINMMEKSIKRLDDFIKDIITYSRNKHLEIEVRNIKFSNLIKISLENFSYLENANKINMHSNVNDKVDFVSDNKRISILLNNFISNAIKYHDVSKDSPSIWINIETTKKEAIIKIKDNGLGMEEEQLDKIFDMFYRISSQIMGTGIGLFIVKEVLAKLKGSIEVESVLGAGTMFTLKIPNESDRK
ncbi:ATP-binding protein [Maribacter sp. ACAM166]|uniref:ATP-binding protein n=1 Tax=Maribacter sp. ACAM166 TaxID=2508996 RepID=UPI0010FD5E7E|nr:ATP-binding protein [Maribacter sp. ACAM166]TLP80697.1 PAS domain S-box protein [Maribacter sp. ACAM166]